LTAGGSISSWDFLWAGDSLRLVELGLFVGPSRRDNLERGNLRVPLARGVLTHEAIEEGSPALGSLVISWRGRIGRLVHARQLRQHAGPSSSTSR
jgi:hypothetical protein